MKTHCLIFLTLIINSPVTYAQQLEPEIRGDSIIYSLTISEIEQNFSGKPVKALAFNESIPGPTLLFTEGKHAVIRVTNNLMHETSVHWHGLLLPNYMDGVPYLTTPPIKLGQTFQYDFPLKQAGTYWFHSHTGLQEQKGVYGSIVIEPRHRAFEYDHDVVILLSDWTDANPMHIFKNLRRHNEWYGIKIGNAPSLVNAIKGNGLGEQLKLWAKKMPGMHISDIYYDTFLINGKQNQHLREFKAGETIRVRVINASASTYFWLQLADIPLTMIASDGLNIQPIEKEKILMGIAETYDFLVTIPESKSLEFRATSQDVTGSVSAFFGDGELISAPEISKPNYVELGKKMAAVHAGETHHNMMLEAEETGTISKFEHQIPEPPAMDHSMHGMPATKVDEKMEGHGDHARHEMQNNEPMEKTTDHEMASMTATNPMLMWDIGYSYADLKSPKATTISLADSVRTLTFNLTGNMWRYVWSINGETLSGAEKIKINRGEVVRITLNNSTMMHHPMHLHGHYFRVLNGQGEFAPLKHTVDVPPMSRITIEFEANEEQDWFFHCHVLYHMMAGMSRIFSYDDPRDERLAPYPVSTLYKEDKAWLTWGDATLNSTINKLNITHANIKSALNLEVDYAWDKNFELNADYEYFTGNYFRIFGGLTSENKSSNSLTNIEIKPQLGVKYLLWYVMDTQLSVDHKLRPQLKLKPHLPLTQRIMLESHIKTTMLTSPFSGSAVDFDNEYELGANYILSEKFSISVMHSSRFSSGFGIRYLF